MLEFDERRVNALHLWLCAQPADYIATHRRLTSSEGKEAWRLAQLAYFGSPTSPTETWLTAMSDLDLMKGREEETGYQQPPPPSPLPDDHGDPTANAYR